MRLPARLGLLACCGVALAACTASPPKGPDSAVTTPAVGRPASPQSAQAALSSEAFTSYAGLGTPGDGLALSDTYEALHTACMNDAGYGQYAENTFYLVGGLNLVDMTAAQPFGPWGYIGAVEAAQYGFNVSMAELSGPPPGSPSPFVGLPAAVQAAAGKCLNIVLDFSKAQLNTSMAGITTMANTISTDVAQDPDLKNATRAWSACMARNGYTAPNASTLTNQELYAVGLTNPGAGPMTPAQNSAQIATAAADAACTQTTDLAGIYFAVQASYEQQIVTANQQALYAAVRQYKTAYAKEISKLPALLRTTSATPAINPAHPR